MCVGPILVLLVYTVPLRHLYLNLVRTIYGGGAFIILFLTVWNRRSTQHLRTIVENVKEAKLQEAAYLRETKRD
ncbi:hypothetical protein LSM04_003429 [Trypanosoma melophagium]|uniref:uncharacterized protein n=1 Tax=Trypanosoma melophagium TaxID=715481 RepID=UPI00351A290C|nr:hypothetical protein LSM04_003429 [Trypanosoma melophagium]